MSAKRKTESRRVGVQPQPPALPEVTLPAPVETFALINRLQELRQTRLLTLVASPDVIMRGDVVEQVYEQLRHIGRAPQIDLFLHSVGGQTEVPWRLITLLRDFCDRFCVLIPALAHSAATHLAMGADEILMGPMSELSPVDPARAHPLLPPQEGQPLTVSVQDLRHCVEFIKKEVAISSPEAMAAVVAALFDKIHPLAIGAIQQAYALARLISTKALSTHMNPETEKEQIDRIVACLSDGFFSHGYRIGWKEAQAIGLKVTRADDELWETMWALYKHYNAYFTVARILKGEHSRAARPIVWIDTVYQRRILEEVQPLNKDEPVMPRWLVVPWQQE